MTKREIRIIEKELLFQSEKKKDIEIIEWGSGGSTHHFTDFLDKHDISYHWTSLEYNKNWYEKISAEVSHNQNISMHLFDVGNNALKQRDTNMEEYINFPQTLNKKFDVVIVDGRKRRRCVLVSKELLSEEGVVFLHDAQRKYYQCLFKDFNISVLLSPGLWKGGNEDVFVKEAYKNILITGWNRIINLIKFPYIWAKDKLRKIIYPV